MLTDFSNSVDWSLLGSMLLAIGTGLVSAVGAFLAGIPIIGWIIIGIFIIGTICYIHFSSKEEPLPRSTSIATTRPQAPALTVEEEIRKYSKKIWFRIIATMEN